LPALTIDLFGVKPQLALSDNISYRGKYSGDDLPNHLTKGWGLVWDGHSLQCCNGQYGIYQQINSPHKASLFLAARIPVIVWQRSAIKNFVVHNRLGISVTSLFDIDEKINALGESQINDIQKQLDLWSARIRIGYFLQKALNFIEGQL
jgi:hypothetical protein